MCRKSKLHADVSVALSIVLPLDLLKAVRRILDPATPEEQSSPLLWDSHDRHTLRSALFG